MSGYKIAVKKYNNALSFRRPRGRLALWSGGFAYSIGRGSTLP